MLWQCSSYADMEQVTPACDIARVVLNSLLDRACNSEVDVTSAAQPGKDMQ